MAMNTPIHIQVIQRYIFPVNDEKNSCILFIDLNLHKKGYCNSDWHCEQRYNKILIAQRKVRASHDDSTFVNLKNLIL